MFGALTLSGIGDSYGTTGMMKSHERTTCWFARAPNEPSQEEVPGADYVGIVLLREKNCGGRWRIG